MSDYSITKKTGTYPTGLPEIKVGEYEETQIIYGEDCLTEIVERLNENIIADAFERKSIVDGALCERLIRERKEAADTIEALRAENAKLLAALKPFADMAKYYDADGIPTTRLIANVQIRLLRAARAAIGKSDDR